MANKIRFAIMCVIITLCISFAVQAQVSFKEGTVVNQQGKPIPGATITVYKIDGVTPATLYNNFTYSSSNTTGANTLQADSLGNYGVYALPGPYKFTISGTGLTPFTTVVVVPPNQVLWDQGGLVYNVMSFGANGLCTADATVAVLSAISTAPSGTTVAFPPGTCLLISSGPIVITKRITLLGYSTDFTTSSRVVNGSASADLFDFNQGSAGSRIIGLTINNSSASPTGGAAINLNNATSLNGANTSPFWIQHCMLSSNYDGIVGTNANEVDIEDDTISADLHDGIKLVGGINYFIERTHLLGNANANIDLLGAQAVHINHSETFNGVNGLVINGSSQVFCDESVFDMASAANILLSGNGNIYGFNNCRAWGSTASWGIDINQSGGGGLTWTGGEIRANWNSGVNLRGSGHNYNFVGVQFSANGLSTLSTEAYGLKVNSAVTYWRVSECMLGPIPGDNSTIQNFGVFVGAVAADHYVITNNLDVGDFSGPVSDSGTGTHKTVSGNI